MIAPVDLAERLGRYRICRQIASGGMATVHLAVMDAAHGFGKLVALKRIHPHLAKETAFVEMFLDEARITSRISHRNVCSVIDFGEVDGSYYIAMEFLDGETLRKILATLRKTPSEADSKRLASYAANIVAQACEGLHAAHEIRGADGQLLDVVHRDVSPQNLFVTYDGGVSLVDFGIAHARDRIHHTSTGIVKGKFSYMSPEQLRQAPVDRRADVWSLGVCLWELLTLRPLFRRSSQASTLAAVMMEVIPPPSHMRRGIPAELDRIVMRALSRKPEDRYQTARELGRDLTRCANEHCDPVEPGELGEWLERLFPGRQERRNQLVELARGNDGALDSSFWDVLLTDEPPISAPPAASAHVPEPEVSAAPSRTDKKWWVLAGFFGGLAIGAAALTGHWITAAKRTESSEEKRNTSDGSLALTSDQSGAIGEESVKQRDEVDSNIVRRGILDAASTIALSNERIDARASGVSSSADVDRRGARSTNRTSRFVRRDVARNASSELMMDPGYESNTAQSDAVERSIDANLAVREPAVMIEPTKAIATQPTDAFAARNPYLRAQGAPSQEPQRTDRIRASAPAVPERLEASATVSSLEVEGSLPTSTVSRAIERVSPSFAACYATAARRAERNAGGVLRIDMHIDETGVVRMVSSSGAPFPTLGSCVESQLRRARTRQPDTGNIRATFQIRFTPVAR